MKAFSIFLLILVIAAGIFVFSKPSDEECVSRAKENLNAQQLSQPPGYDNPMDENTKGQTSADAIMIKDKFLWKQVDYSLKGDIKTIGYGYLGSFHSIKSKKKND